MQETQVKPEQKSHQTVYDNRQVHAVANARFEREEAYQQRERNKSSKISGKEEKAHIPHKHIVNKNKNDRIVCEQIALMKIGHELKEKEQI